jgi:hypothetical protein
VSEQIKDAAGRDGLDDALAHQKAGLHTPEQQAIHLAIPVLEGNGLAFTKPQLMAAAKEFEQDSLSLQAIEGRTVGRCAAATCCRCQYRRETACSCWSHASRTTLKKHYPPRPGGKGGRHPADG